MLIIEQPRRTDQNQAFEYNANHQNYEQAEGEVAGKFLWEITFQTSIFRRGRQRHHRNR